MKRLILSLFTFVLAVSVGLVVWAFRINDTEPKRIYAEQLATERIFEIVESDTSDGNSDENVFGVKSYKIKAAGVYSEVLYKGLCNDSFIMKAWIDSPKHKVIIADKTYKGFAERKSYYNDTECYVVRVYYK